MLKYMLDVLFFGDLVTSVYFPLHRQPLSTSHARYTCSAKLVDSFTHELPRLNCTSKEAAVEKVMGIGIIYGLLNKTTVHSLHIALD